MAELIDAYERERALTADESFIVQAPAGSGKTEILIQRILVLLAHVQQPEEILAITFTRKAAAEMKNRLLESLAAACGSEPVAEHQKKNWRLAREVIRRDKQLAWSLRENPTRLRVMTIDALSSQLAMQLPATAFLGGGFSVTENVDELYQQTALTVLLQQRADAEFNEALHCFLKHRHNDYQNAAALLAQMLHSRHVWLPFFEMGDGDQSRQFFEVALEKLINEDLSVLKAYFDAEDFFSDRVLGLMCQLSAYSQNVALNWQSVPDSKVSFLEHWQAFCRFFLNQKGELRQSFTKKQGIPTLASVSGEEKKQLQALRQALKECVGELSLINDRSEGQLLLKMQRVAGLPQPCYSDDDWRLLWSIGVLLKELVAKLWLQFGHRHQLDFTQVALGALDALADQRGVTDLALALDYKVSHLLCDEFQDTSKIQLRLFELLSAGWQQGDGRTLFFVGDPMQSIYRFRHAEVEIFLDVRNKGLANHTLTPLVLKTNFRSQEKIVHWINQACQQFFPRVDNLTTGAVCYHPSKASSNTVQAGDVYTHLVSSDEEETEKIISLIQNYLTSTPQGKIAVLVRSRSHLHHLIPALQQVSIAYQAVEIASLAERMVATDIITLITVMVQPYHRLAWLAFLRTPWCGLELADLEVIAACTASLWQVIARYEQLALSVDACARLARVVPVLREAFFQRGRLSLRYWVQGVWEALGGSAALSDENDFADAMCIFDLFEEESRLGEVNLDTLKARIEVLKASSCHNQARVQLMTIHKAKGLEFDCVILPRLHQGQTRSQQDLLLWLSRGYGEPVLAPIPEKRQTQPLYDYIRSLEADKNRHERMRLLYVALTRAKSELHLLGQVKLDKKESVKLPMAGSFLRLLWPLMKLFGENLQANNREEAECATTQVEYLDEHNYRLPLSWSLPADRYGVSANNYEYCLSQQERCEVHGFDNAELLPEHFHWHGMDERAFGQVCHQLLCVISRTGVVHWKKIDRNDSVFIGLLRRYGIVGLKKEMALKNIHGLLDRIESSELAAYLLSADRIKARSEYVLLAKRYGRVSRHIVDRTFYDDEGVRWVIDFKTSKPSSNDAEEIKFFFESEKKAYENQMKRYWQLFTEQGDPLVKVALYFPWLDQLLVYDDI